MGHKLQRNFCIFKGRVFKCLFLIHTVSVLQWFAFCTLWITKTFKNSVSKPLPPPPHFFFKVIVAEYIYNKVMVWSFIYGVMCVLFVAFAVIYMHFQILKGEMMY